MKLARFETVAEHILKDHEVREFATSLSLYRFFDAQWFDDAGEIVLDNHLIEALGNTLTVNHAWRAQKSFLTYFPIQSLDAVAVMTSAAPTRANTRSRIQRRLDECVEVGTNAFKANYDHLTGLLNRDAFDRALQDEVSRLAASHKIETDELEKVEPRGATTVISFDIDFFKQVNDTFGHLYGDIVLQCLAQRVDALCKERSRQDDGRVRVYCARPSGEEFSILLAGVISKEQENAFAELIRSDIELTPLPDDQEWVRATRGGVPEGLVLPHASARKLSISVGVSSIRRLLKTAEIGDVIRSLKNRADLALYKAKKSGRNQVVAFSDILSLYGRIVEHDRGTDVVAIDIGQQVGVSIGQEFIVYDSKFTGGRPFILDDGRTQKTIGTYPRVLCGRVEVFDVQREISFCKVIECTGMNGFSVGAALEAVPVGSIEHLIKSDIAGISAVVPLSALEAAVAEMVERNKAPAACAIALVNSESLLEDYGTAYVNRVLAKLFEVMQSGLPLGTKIGLAGRTQLAAVIPRNALKDAEIGKMLDAVDVEFKGVPRLAAGVLTEKDITEFNSSQHKGQLDPLGALDLARFALLVVQEGGERIRHFSSSVPGAVIHASRSARNVERAVADYQLLVKLGAQTAALENQLALTFYENGKPEEAVQPIQRAVDLDQEQIFYWLNAVLINFQLKNYTESVEGYLKALAINPSLKLSPPYLQYVALSLFKALTELNVLAIEPEHIRVLVGEALSLDSSKLRETTRAALVEANEILEGWGKAS